MLGHPVQHRQCDKKLCSLPPSVEFYASVMWCDANLHAATFMQEISDRRFKPTTRLRVDIAHEDNGTEDVLKVNKELVIIFHRTKCTLWLRTENKMTLFLGCIHYVYCRGDGGGNRGYFLNGQNISISPRHHTEFYDIPSLTKRKNDTPPQLLGK